MQGDRYLFAASGNKILRFDTQTFVLTDDQIPTLSDYSDETGRDDLSGDVAGLMIRGSHLYAVQTDGDLVTVDLDDVAADPSTTTIFEGALGDFSFDSDTADNSFYILNEAQNSLFVWDLGDETSTSIPLLDGFDSPVSPTALAFVSPPSGTDKIYVASGRSLVYVLPEGQAGFTNTITLAGTNKNLSALAASPDGDFLFVLDTTDDTVHVIDTATDAEIDGDPVTVGVNPISFPQNSGLNAITVTDVSDPNDVYVYVSGSAGLSVVDLNLGAGFTAPSILDFDDQGSGDNDDDPLVLSSTPGKTVASSAADGYVYSSNGNAGISVITANPFIDIEATSLTGDTLAVGGSFTIQFSSDETGTYRVRVGGDQTETGSLADSGTVATADASQTTAEITYDSSLFSEGANRVFVFVEDADGNVGRDAVDITVDTPPPAVTITGVGFGNEKIVVSFERLTTSDLASYRVYVDSNSAAIATATDPIATIVQPSSGGSVEARIAGLTNGTTYYVGVEAVDQTGNVGPRTTTLASGAAASATPEETVGLAGRAGETGGCGLMP